MDLSTCFDRQKVDEGISNNLISTKKSTGEPRGTKNPFFGSKGERMEIDHGKCRPIDRMCHSFPSPLGKLDRGTLQRPESNVRGVENAWTRTNNSQRQQIRFTLPINHSRVLSSLQPPKKHDKSSILMSECSLLAQTLGRMVLSCRPSILNVWLL